MSPNEAASPRCRWFLPVALAVTAFVWAFGLPGDLWLDEIYFINFASALRSPVEIVTAPSLDGNHPLTTFAVWLLGPRRPEYAYRLLAYAAGLGAVALIGLLGRRYGERVSGIATVLGGGCFFMFVYAVEARGYAPVAFASLLSFFALAAYLDRGGRKNLALYWLSVPLGLLAHASYVYSFAGCLSWSVPALARKCLSPRREALRIHGVPVLLVVSYIPWLLTRTNIGGTEYRLERILLDVAVFTTGMPDRFPANALAGIALLLAVAAGWRQIARERSPDHVFFAVTILAAPAVATLFAVVTENPYVYARYYLAAVPFTLILVAKAIDGLAARFPRAGTPGIAALLALFLAGNGLMYDRFLDGRRGTYREAIRYMRAHTAGATMTILTKTDFPTRTVIDYYLPRNGSGGNAVVYATDAVSPASPPEWLISDYQQHVNDVVGDENGPFYRRFILFPQGFIYEFERSFRAGGPSGYSWNIYRHCISCNPSPDLPIVDFTPRGRIP